MTRMSARAAGMWSAYCTASGIDPATRCDVFAFGDSAELADELAELVRAGPKRATAELVATFEHDQEELPEPGSHSIVLDSREEPACVIQTTEITIKPVGEVDAAFAWDEGEGGRTVASWLAAHRSYFARTCAARRQAYDDSLLCVFERFVVVWPLSTESTPPA